MRKYLIAIAAALVLGAIALSGASEVTPSVGSSSYRPDASGWPLSTMAAMCLRIPGGNTIVPSYEGEWAVDVEWDFVPIYSARHWSGTMHLRDAGDRNYGTLELSCREIDWIVAQDVEATGDGRTMHIQGSNVRAVQRPSEDAIYGWDRFELSRNAESALTFAGNAGGEYEGTGTAHFRYIGAGSYRSPSSLFAPPTTEGEATIK